MNGGTVTASVNRRNKPAIAAATLYKAVPAHDTAA